MDEKAYTDIYNYQSSSTYPANASKNDKRALRQKVQPFTIINERLHHKGCKGKLQQVVKVARPAAADVCVRHRWDVTLGRMPHTEGRLNVSGRRQ